MESHPGRPCLTASQALEAEGEGDAAPEILAAVPGAVGIPLHAGFVVDCPCGGPDYLINDGENGFLVPVGDDEKMAEKISYLIDHPEEAEAMGDKAKAIADQARPEVIAKTWLDFIEQAIG